MTVLEVTLNGVNKNYKLAMRPAFARAIETVLRSGEKDEKGIIDVKVTKGVIRVSYITSMQKNFAAVEEFLGVALEKVGYTGIITLTMTRNF